MYVEVCIMDRNKLIYVIAGGVSIVVICVVLFMALKGCNTQENKDGLQESSSIYIIDEGQTDGDSNTGSEGRFSKENNSVVDVNNSDVNSLENSMTNSKDKYYLKLNGDIVTIYKNNEFYDYARVDSAELPQEILSELKMGMVLAGEERLYEFLQGYAD